MTTENNKDRSTGLIISIALHLMLLLIFLLPFTRPIKAKETPNPIIVQFVSAQTIANDVDASPKPKTQSTKSKSSTSSKKKSQSKTKKTNKIKSQSSKSTASTEIVSKTTYTDESDIKAASEKKNETKKNEDKASVNFGNVFSGIFGGSDNDGNDESPSDQLGDISTAPNASGGGNSNGLGKRGILYKPVITDNTSKEGRVVVYICVDQNGNVMSTEFNQKKSNTSDTHLIKLAKDGARKYKFSPKADENKECGNITIDFSISS